MHKLIKPVFDESCNSSSPNLCVIVCLTGDYEKFDFADTTPMVSEAIIEVCICSWTTSVNVIGACLQHHRPITVSTPSFQGLVFVSLIRLELKSVRLVRSHLSVYIGLRSCRLSSKTGGQGWKRSKVHDAFWLLVVHNRWTICASVFLHLGPIQQKRLSMQLRLMDCNPADSGACPKTE